MNQFDEWLRSIAAGLNAMAEGIQSIAKMFDEMADAKTPEKPLKVKPEPQKTVASSKPAPEKPDPRKARPAAATEKVLRVIADSKTGLDNATISKKTGLNQKQVSSALLRLKKYGKIKSVKRGVHTAV
jgi:predicted Rossmann fold nucleotide-binding protein DprA/Smf involved in DNA uptake